MKLTEAIIAGIATIISAIITVLITKILDRPNYVSIKKSRREALDGKWEGEFSQISNDQTISSYLYFRLTVLLID